MAQSLLTDEQKKKVRDAPDGQRFSLRGREYIKRGGQLVASDVTAPVASPTPAATPASAPVNPLAALRSTTPMSTGDVITNAMVPFAPPPWLRDMLVPKSQTGKAAVGTALAGDIAAAAFPEMGLPAKAAIEVAPIAVGALSGYQQKGIPGLLRGATEAAATTLPGLGIAAGYGRHLTRQMDAGRIASTIAKHMPAMQPVLQAVLKGGQKARDVVVALDRLFRGREGKEMAGTALESTKQAVSDVVGDRKFVIPQLIPNLDENGLLPESYIRNSLSKNYRRVKITPELRKQLSEEYAQQHAMSFADADRAITENWDASYSPISGDPRGAVGGAKLRRLTHEGRDELIRQLSEVDPNLAQQYRNDRNQMTTAMTLNRIFKQPDVIKSGRVNMEKLQKLIERGKYREALEGLDIGPDFLSAAFREAPPISTDITPGVGLSFHGGLPPRPRLYAHVAPRTVGRTVRIPRSLAMTAPRMLLEGAGDVLIPGQPVQER